MQKQLLTLFTNTPLHVGAGSSVGVVDQPIFRERHTSHPVIPGSTLKGVLSDFWNDEQFQRNDRGKKLFGKMSEAGTVLIGDARLLAFPVRSARGGFAWLTSPLCLRRFLRDFPHFEMPGGIPSPNEDQIIVAQGSKLIFSANGSRRIVLEDFPLALEQGKNNDWVDRLNAAMPEKWRNDLPGHLAIVSDDLLSYFTRTACEIANHNRLSDLTGVVENTGLFSQENVPSETLFYSVLRGTSNDLEEIAKNVPGEIQIGADATTGLGWCSVTWGSREA